MRTDTLSYKYHYQAKPTDFFNVILKEQLQYFQRTDPSIKLLKPGTTIEAHLQTKMNKIQTENKMSVKQIVPNQLFQLETQQTGGTITQTFELDQDRHGKNRVIYSEQNNFEQGRNQMNFVFMGALYKFFYNRGIKKRMQFLDKLATGQAVG